MFERSEEVFMFDNDEDEEDCSNVDENPHIIFD